MYTSFDADNILLFVGSLSGIVVDFIGATFIKMYTQNIEEKSQLSIVSTSSAGLLFSDKPDGNRYLIQKQKSGDGKSVSAVIA